MRILLLVAGALWLCATQALAADVGVTARKLFIQDFMASQSKAKVKLYSRYDPGITKGSGLDPADISAQVDIAYVNGATTGTFLMPAGAFWLVNNPRIAMYVNKAAPIGSSTKVGVIRPVKKLLLSAKSLGETPIDILGAGDPGPMGVRTVFTVTNGAETTRHCTLFTTCFYKLYHLDVDAKLKCHTGVPTACPSAP